MGAFYKEKNNLGVVMVEELMLEVEAETASGMLNCRLHRDL